VSHRYKFLLGWSAKCGCSSIKKWYVKSHQLSAPEDGNIHKLIGYGGTEYSRVDWEDPDRYKQYHKFLVVRNPYARLVSGFVNKYVGRHYDNDGWDSFKEFIQVLEEDRELERINRHHFTPQFSEDYEKFGNHYTFDKVFKLEDLQKGLDKVSRITGAPRTLVSVANKSKHIETAFKGNEVSTWSIAELKAKRRNLPPSHCFYTYALVEQVKRIYQKDFDALKALGIQYRQPKLGGKETFPGKLNALLDSGNR
jgi:hypothetical protein